MILLIADGHSSLLKSALAQCSRSVSIIETNSPVFSASLERHLNDSGLEIAVIDCLAGERACLNSLDIVKKRRADVPVIFVVSSGSDEVMEKALRLGARECFRKPFNVMQFKERISILQRLKRSTRERRTPLLARENPFPRSPFITTDIPKGVISAINFIEDHVADRGLSLKRLASAAGMSPFHFCRIFKRHTSVTPMRFLVQKRLELAKALLTSASGNMTISQIANAVGFYDSSNFNKHFKRSAGITPSDYRQAASPGKPQASRPEQS